VVNTADDFEHLGLKICPDLDTVMYTLAGLNDQQRGWGLAGESWNALQALQKLGAESWFQLGDRDLATHIVRSQRLAQGHTLSQVTAQLCSSLGVGFPVLPMTDDPVSTYVVTGSGELSFQHYFVREQCQPVISGVHFRGIETARPQPQFIDLLSDEKLAAIVICPSNPFVSVKPILNLLGVRQAMRDSQAPVIAVSPIVSGMAIKGPAAKMMAELNMPTSAAAVADDYGDLLDGFVIDQADSDQAEWIEQRGIKVLTTQTVMHSLEDRISLAEDVIAFSATWNGRFERCV
ncbi:MAG: 2-phospho-L-lactate transferase, partial [Gammaproteobacteria bacterium]|nr:2-phospho-L-lactate transferase [Gammaproteobacteria bacterium]